MANYMDDKKDNIKMKIYVLDEMIKKMADIEGEKAEGSFLAIFPKEEMKKYKDKSEHMSFH